MPGLRLLHGSCVAALLLCTASGCMTGYFGRDDPNSSFEPGTEQWWAEKAQLPVGARQVYKKGKLWPPRPRPTGEKQQMSHIFHANHYWPHPYVCQDREYVRSVFEQQAANGWADQTTLYSYHFSETTHELNVPGRSHLAWILNQTPDRYRTVYLQRQPEEHINQMRIASVQRALGALVTDGSAPSVQWRTGTPPSRPAAEVQTIQTMELQSIVPPVIGGGGGGGASASGGSGGSGT